MQKVNSTKNIILAAVISLGFMLIWQYFYEIPNQKKLAAYEREQNSKTQITKTQEKSEETNATDTRTTRSNISASMALPSNLILSKTAEKRVNFENDFVKGSINLVGLRLDDLTLKKYNHNLLSPAGARGVQFIEFGFAAPERNIILPTTSTEWRLVRKLEDGLIAEWKSPQNVLFTAEIRHDEAYRFNVVQSVQNSSGRSIEVAVYTRIYRSPLEVDESAMISHEGFIGLFDGRFNELKYSKIKDDQKRIEIGQKGDFWGGFSDKYWFTAFSFDNKACGDACQALKSDISMTFIASEEKYQIDYLTSDAELANGATVSFNSNVFAGAKELKILDMYEDILKLRHFDKIVDFGLLYFLTKPIFMLLTLLNSFLHNFGLSIIVLTMLVKLILMPISTKSYVSMGKMKSVSPQVEAIKSDTSLSKQDVSRRIMLLYREKQINPLSGCLPIFLQIPVFFALYKVLYISIEMRGAEFIWWIKDLSKPDPTSIFNLFGALPFETPGFLTIGVLPILLGLTTYLQQLLSPKSADPTQAMIMRFLPIVLTFIFAGFPAGIVLYWVMNNLISIAHQFYVEKIILPRLLKRQNRS